MSAPKYLAQINRLVSDLPSNSRAVLVAHCEVVELVQHAVLAHAGDDLRDAYFPLDSFVGVIQDLDATNVVQVDLIGNEGMVNDSLTLGVRVASLKTVVQGAGRAFRIDHAALQKLLASDSTLHQALNRYVNHRIAQLARNMACAGLHPVDQRLARWLLEARDRAHSSELLLTQEVLALMLGVRRETVTLAARKLQRQGWITYIRGDLTMVNEPALEAAACACYRAGLPGMANSSAGGHRIS